MANDEKENCYNLAFTSTGGELSEFSKNKKSTSLKRNYKNNPKLRDDSRIRMKLYFSDEKNKEYMKTDWFRKSLSDGQKNRHSDPEKKLKHKEVMNDINVRDKISNGLDLFYTNNPDRLLEIGLSKRKYDSYKIKNNITGEFFEGTQYDFRKKYGLNKSSVGNLIKGRNSTLHGWSIVE
jgi:hypothetical protein